MPRLNVALIDSDLASRRSLEDVIRGIEDAHLAGSVSDLESGYELAIRNYPNVVILELDSNPALALDMMARMLKLMPQLCILATSRDSSAENILKSIRHGAADFLPRPVREDDLVEALKKSVRLKLNGKGTSHAVENGRIITCFSPKGGMGNSTTAVNLAVSLHQLTGKGVVLVDLDLECGDLSMFLNLNTKYSFSDVTENVGRLDNVFLQGVLAKHPSGIYFLSEPQKVEVAAGITPAQVHEVLNVFRTMFPYIVVDTEMGYGDRNLAVFDSSDLILLVGILSLPAVKNLQKTLDVFERIGFDGSKIKLLINRYVKKGDMSIEDVERTLDCKVFKSIPNDYANVMMSINRGQPLAALAPGSEISRAYKDLAAITRDLVGGPSKKAGQTGRN